MSERADNEMGQIQKGLEDFLERELQLYTIEEEEEQEKELDIIGGAVSNKRNTGNRKNTTAKRQPTSEYKSYGEDWDSGPRKSDSGRSLGNSRPNQKGKSKLAQEKSESRRKSSKSFQEKSEPHRKSSKSSQEKSEPRQRRSKSRKKKRGSGLKKFFVIVIVILALIGFALYQAVGAVYHKMHYSEIDAFTGLPMQEDGVINILLIGNDSRENGEDGRSDAMILLSISSRTKTIYMTSLLRDMYVEIPGRNGNRLNAAYSYGGAELLMKTVEQNFDIPVNRYIQVNFEAFAGLVDAVDGVDLELTSQEIEYVNGYLVEYNMLTNRPQGTDNMDTSVSGLVHLNGPQALAYCRNRYLGTDFGRTERQRKVLSAVIEKLPKAAVTNTGELVDGLMPNLTTNLTQGEAYRLSLMSGRLLTYDIISDNIPQPGTYKDATIRGMAVLEVDFDANKKFLREKIYGEQE